jgi:hypothetical protein
MRFFISTQSKDLSFLIGTHLSGAEDRHREITIRHIDAVESPDALIIDNMPENNTGRKIQIHAQSIIQGKIQFSGFNLRVIFEP